MVDDDSFLIRPDRKGSLRPVLQKDRAYQSIKAFLFDDDGTDTIYSERFLSSELEIGLASVRSAVERLRSEGIIETIPKGGIRLPQITPSEVVNFYEIRMVLEPYLVGRIAGNLTEGQRKALSALIERQKMAATDADTGTYHVLDLRFHEDLARIHGNGEMMRALGQMRDKMFRLSRRLHRSHPERLAVNAGQHQQIVEAVCEGRAGEAISAMKEHLAWGRDFTLNPDART